MLPPSSKVDSCRFHITQLGEVYQKTQSPRLRFQCSPSCLSISTRMPPWLCTSPLGTPVVPDENSTHSGWPKSTARAAISPPAVACSHGITLVSDDAPPRRVIATVVCTVSDNACLISLIAAVRSCSRPLKV